MHVPFAQYCPKLPMGRRGGVFAATEILLLLIMLPGLCWVGANLAVSSGNESASPDRVSMCGVCRISIDRNGERLWVYRRCCDVTQINLRTAEVDQSLPLYGMELFEAAHSRDNSTSLLCAMDGTVILNRAGETVRTTRLNTPENVLDSAVSSAGETAVFITAKGRIQGWVRRGTDEREFHYFLDSIPEVVQIGLDRSGQRLCMARCDGTVTFHATETGLQDGQPIDIGDRCCGLVWSDDERRVAVMTLNGMVKVYDVATGRLDYEAATNDPVPNATHTAMAISADGRLVAAATISSGDIRIWDAEKRILSGCLYGHVGVVRTLQFSPASERLYSGGFDGTVREWSLATFREIRTID